ncbi:hypothetical protein ACFX2J_014059 [Malus domestica]
MKEESVQSNLLSFLFLQMFVRMNSSFELNFSFLGALKERIILHSSPSVFHENHTRWMGDGKEQGEVDGL